MSDHGDEDPRQVVDAQVHAAGDGGAAGGAQGEAQEGQVANVPINVIEGEAPDITAIRQQLANQAAEQKADKRALTNQQDRINNQLVAQGRLLRQIQATQEQELAAARQARLREEQQRHRDAIDVVNRVARERENQRQVREPPRVDYRAEDTIAPAARGANRTMSTTVARMMRADTIPQVELAREVRALTTALVDSLGEAIPNDPRTRIEECLDRIGTHTEAILDAENQTRTRMVQAAAISTITDLPRFGERTDLPDLRNYRIDDFKGDREKCEKDPNICMDWLRKIVTHANELGFTEQATIRFMQRHATQEAGRVLAAAVEEGKALLDIFYEFETNWAGLKHPDVAQEECRRMVRRPRETILAFGSRVKLVAQMAKRQRLEPKEAAEILAEDALLAALPPYLKIPLRTKFDERQRVGAPKPNFTELMHEAHRLEVEREATNQIYQSRKGLTAQNANVRYLENNEEEWPESDEEGEGSHSYIREIKEKKQGDKAQPQWRSKPAADRPRAATGRFLKYQPEGANWSPPTKWGSDRRKPGSPEASTIRAIKYEGKNESREEEINYLSHLEDGDYVLQEGFPEGIVLRIMQPNKAEYTKKFISFTTLNVERDECAKCGLTGHHIGDGNKCPLRESDLQEKPCAHCNKGGHLAKECLRRVDLFKAKN